MWSCDSKSSCYLLDFLIRLTLCREAERERERGEGGIERDIEREREGGGGVGQKGKELDKIQLKGTRGEANVQEIEGISWSQLAKSQWGQNHFNREQNAPHTKNLHTHTSPTYLHHAHYIPA